VATRASRCDTHETFKSNFRAAGAAERFYSSAGLDCRFCAMVLKRVVGLAAAFDAPAHGNGGACWNVLGQGGRLRTDEVPHHRARALACFLRTEVSPRIIAARVEAFTSRHDGAQAFSGWQEIALETSTVQEKLS